MTRLLAVLAVAGLGLCLVACSGGPNLDPLGLFSSSDPDPAPPQFDPAPYAPPEAPSYTPLPGGSDPSYAPPSYDSGYGYTDPGYTDPGYGYSEPSYPTPTYTDPGYGYPEPAPAPAPSGGASCGAGGKACG